MKERGKESAGYVQRRHQESIMTFYYFLQQKAKVIMKLQLSHELGFTGDHACMKELVGPPQFQGTCKGYHVGDVGKDVRREVEEPWKEKKRKEK
jgi:hypothetical protein